MKREPEPPAGEDVLGVVPCEAREAAARKLRRDNLDGKAMFMVCQCQSQEEHPAGFIPVVVRERGEVYISSLVCVECGVPGYFAEGRLIVSDEENDE